MHVQLSICLSKHWFEKSFYERVLVLNCATVNDTNKGFSGERVPGEVHLNNIFFIPFIISSSLNTYY